jgi:cell division protein FtsL
VRFAELEVAQQDGKTLESDGARLRSDRDRASQPAMVEAAARRLGMRPIAPDRIVNLPGAAPATISATAPSVIATSATATSTTIAQERAR